MKKILFSILFLVIILYIPSLVFADTTDVRIKFSKNVVVKGQVYPFTDAIYWSIADYDKLRAGDASILATLVNEKNSRIENFRQKLLNPPVQAEPTKEELTEWIARITQSQETLEQQKQDYQNKLDVLIHQGKVKP